METSDTQTERPDGLYWICTGCHAQRPRSVRPVLRGARTTLLQMMFAAPGYWASLCPHCAEKPPEPDEIEPPYDVVNDDADGMDIIVDAAWLATMV